MTLTSAWTTFAEWSAAFDRRTADQPWPGPRPLTSADDREALIGRETDVNAFEDYVIIAKLAQLTGSSGVGKSSMLYAGLIPALREKYVVVYCNQWNIGPDKQFDEHLAEQLHQSLPTGPLPAGHQGKEFAYADTNLFYDLNDLGENAIVVLDQFEEILRQDIEGPEALELLTELLTAFNFKVVLSYRSEYSNVVRELEARGNWVKRAYELPPLGDDVGLEIITSPLTGATETEHEVITDDAATLLDALWRAARLTSTRTEIAVGPLHLQAALTALWHENKGSTITADNVRTFFARDDRDPVRDALVDEPATALARVERWQRTRDRADVDVESRNHLYELRDQTEVYRAMFDLALEKSATQRLLTAQDAARDIGMDDYLSQGIGYWLSRIVPQLSSGTYKLERDLAELATQVMTEELDATAQACRIPRQDVAAVLATITRSNDLRERTMSLTRRALKEDPALARVLADLPTTFDPVNAPGAGPMSTLAPLDVLLEEVRRFCWALKWLDALHLARTADSDERTAVTLVHDGLGKALDRWSKTHEEQHATWALHALTAPRGKTHEWATDKDHESLSGQPGRPKVHVNLGLQGNLIFSAHIRNAVFVNADLRGTFFRWCTFEAVTFLNCLLDGAILTDCTIINTTGEATPMGSGGKAGEGGLAYVLTGADGAPEELVAVLARYRELDETDLRLEVARAGGASGPVHDDLVLHEWKAPSQGLLIEGGRVSAFTLRNLTFIGDSTVQLKRVSGSGIDVAELGGREIGSSPATFEFSECDLRHVVFSRPPTEKRQADFDTSMETEQRATDLVVTIDGSSVAQWWVGPGLRGTVSVKDSNVAQLWVESDQIEAEHTTGAAVGLVGVESAGSGLVALPVPDAAAGLPPATDEQVDKVRDRFRRMDYRRA